VEATRARGAVSLIVGTLFFGVLENLRRACDLCINHIADAETKAEGVFALTGCYLRRERPALVITSAVHELQLKKAKRLPLSSNRSM